MRILHVPVPGDPQALCLGDAAKPDPGPEEVLIRVAACGINAADLLQRRGRYPSPPGAPAYPGLEVAGTVETVGDKVSEFHAGDRVCALLAGGGYAEYCVAPQGQVLPVPAGIALEQAAALPEACFTAWSNIWGYGRLAPGERLLVHGGASGVGSVAIQIARALGHTVYTTAGTDDKCRFAESLGATLAINYRHADFVAAIRTHGQGRGVDVILDLVGGDYVPRNLRALDEDGRLVVIALQRGKQAEVDLALMMSRRLTLTGSTLRARPAAFKATIKQALLQQVWPLYETGAVKPVVDRVFPFAQAAQAHAYMERGVHKGKLLLRLDARA